MKNLKKNLQAVNRELKALAKLVQKMIQETEQVAKQRAKETEVIKKLQKLFGENERDPKKSKELQKLPKKSAVKKPKAKVVKRKPAKKTAARKVAVKKRVVKKVVAKKSAKTVIGTVLTIIRRSKKGVNTAALMKKTGFSEKQIHNNVYKLKKQGKVESVGKGVYLKI